MLKVTYIGNSEDKKEVLQKAMDASNLYPYVLSEATGGFILCNREITINDEERLEIVKTYIDLKPNEARRIKVGSPDEYIAFTVSKPY